MLRVPHGGQADHGDIIFPQLREQRKAVQPRQHHVQQRQIVVVIHFQCVPGGKTIIKDGDGVVCAFEIQLYRFGDGSVVLYHQNTVAHGIISLPSTFYHSRAHGCLPKCYRADI